MSVSQQQALITLVWKEAIRRAEGKPEQAVVILPALFRELGLGLVVIPEPIAELLASPSPAITPPAGPRDTRRPTPAAARQAAATRSYR